MQIILSEDASPHQENGGRQVERNHYVTSGISTHKGKNKANVLKLLL